MVRSRNAVFVPLAVLFAAAALLFAFVLRAQPPLMVPAHLTLLPVHTSAPQTNSAPAAQANGPSQAAVSQSSASTHKAVAPAPAAPAAPAQAATQSPNVVTPANQPGLGCNATGTHGTVAPECASGK